MILTPIPSPVSLNVLQRLILWSRPVVRVLPLCGSSGSGRFGYCLWWCWFVFIAIRHLRGFWFSRKLRGDQGQAGALADGGPGVDGLRTVGGQHPAVLPDTAGDGQTGLVPHGFCEGELRRDGRKEPSRSQSFWKKTRFLARTSEDTF